VLGGLLVVCLVLILGRFSVGLLFWLVVLGFGVWVSLWGLVVLFWGVWMGRLMGVLCLVLVWVSCLVFGLIMMGVVRV
jgi:hypothetical protein